MSNLLVKHIVSPKVMSNEESYEDRRRLFRNIWETAMNIDGKEDIMTKPKVIKTLRLDEVDKCVVGKSKKQRIKNLRHVCKKILEFCDKQDSDDSFYEKIAVFGQEATQDKHTTEMKALKKTKTHTIKQKLNKAESMFGPSNRPTQQLTMVATVSERKNELSRKVTNKTSSNTSPNKIKKDCHVKNSAKSKKSSMNIGLVGSNSSATKSPVPATRRRVVRKIRSKRKKQTTSDGLTTGHMLRSRPTTRAAVNPTEKKNFK